MLGSHHSSFSVSSYNLHFLSALVISLPLPSPSQVYEQEVKDFLEPELQNYFGILAALLVLIYFFKIFIK